MTNTRITRSFTSSFSSIFLIKLRNFLRKSSLRYLAAASMLALGIQLFNQQNLFTLSTIALISGLASLFISLSFTVMFFSSLFLAHARKSSNMTISFGRDDIIVKNDVTGVAETKNWDWIHSYEEWKGYYFLRINLSPIFDLVLAKDKLSDEENGLFCEWLDLHKKAHGFIK